MGRYLLKLREYDVKKNPPKSKTFSNVSSLLVYMQCCNFDRTLKQNNRKFKQNQMHILLLKDIIFQFLKVSKRKPLQRFKLIIHVYYKKANRVWARLTVNCYIKVNVCVWILCHFLTIFLNKEDFFYRI